MSPAASHQVDIDNPHSGKKRHSAVPMKQYANKSMATRAMRASPGGTIVPELCCSMMLYLEIVGGSVRVEYCTR